MTFRHEGQQDIYYKHRNVTGESVAIHPMAMDEVGYYFSVLRDRNFFTPKERPVREWNFEFKPDDNQYGLERLLLEDEGGNPLKPGYYYIIRREKKDGAILQRGIFSISTDNVVLKSSSTEGLAWVTDLESGEPQANVPVTFYDSSFREIGKGRTNLEGTVLIKNLDRLPYYALAGDDAHFGFTAIEWDSGARPGDFGISYNYYGGYGNLFAYMYTDRAIYRPGQQVHFKGILRRDDDLHYSLPGDKPVFVTCQFSGEIIYEKYVTLTTMGSFADVFSLSPDAAVGTYTISAFERMGDGYSIIKSVNFRVAEYEKPDFEIRVEPEEANILIGESAIFNVDAAYYSGGSVSNAMADWFIELDNYYFTPSKEYSGYSFRNWERDLYYSEEKQSTKKTTLSGEDVQMDAKGHVEIPREFLPADVSTSQQAAFGVNVTDTTGNVVSSGTSIVIHQSEYYAGIRSGSYVAVQGQPQTFDVVVLDWDSMPVPNRQVTVRFVERKWYNVQEKDAQGNLRWKSSVKEIPAGQVNAVTGEDGRAMVEFTPSKGGVFKALVMVEDNRRNLHQSSTYFWAAGRGYVPWRQTNDNTFSLVADKEFYQPGETAKLLIAQPFNSEVYALVTYERGHIYKNKVLKLTGNSTVYELPITDEFAPIAYVSVTVISGVNASGVPNYKVGMAKINIDAAQKELNVEVTTDKKTAGPGDEITYTIKTTDYAGRPVIADVSLAVIDKAVLALTGPNSPPMLETFYAPRVLSIFTANGLITSADAYNQEFREAIADGSASGGGGGSEGVITVRQDFKDTAVFRAQIITDENGEAQVTFTLPENLTTWVADVRAVTADSLVGEGSVEMQTNKPLYVQIQTPRFFVAGDEVEIGAAIHNNTKCDLSVDVSLDADGVKLDGESQQRVDVPAGQQMYVTWNGTVPPDSERVDLTASAVSGDLNDASKPLLGILDEQGIPVLRYTVQETVGTSGMITGRGSITEAMLLPNDSTYINASVDVDISPSLVASIQPSLTYLEDFPYLCMEQTTSRILPNVITKRILEEAGISNELSANLDEQVSDALQRIYAYQLYDGGWNWWRGPESDPYTTAYVVYGLLETKRSGYAVSDLVLTNGLNYLKNNLPYLNVNAPEWERNRQAFILYVLAEGGELLPGAPELNYLYKNNDRLSLYGKAYLTQAMHLLDPEDERIASLLSDLQAGATISASGMHWEEDYRDYHNWNSDTRTTAIVLNAYVQIAPENPITANTVRWLMASRAGKHWASTQDTTWALVALVNWLSQQGEFDPQYNYAIGLNGETLNEGSADPQRLTKTAKLKIELETMLKDETNFLVISRGSGDGNLYYTAFLNAEMNVPDVKPVERGIFIMREYFALDDEETPVTSAEMGDLLRARLTIVAPSALYYLAVDDPLPAGFEAVDATLKTDTTVPSTITIAGLKERGWGWWHFNNIQIQDEKISFAASYLPAGTYVYTYLVRASNRGTFNVLPPSAFEFYFPDVNGHGAGSTFVVR